MFEKVTGMVVGKLVGCEEKDDERMLPDIKEILLEITKEYGFPIIGNADFGHSGIFMPMPEGLLADMDAESLSLELVESMVR